MPREMKILHFVGFPALEIPHFVGNAALEIAHFVGIDPLKTVHFIGVMQDRGVGSDGPGMVESGIDLGCCIAERTV